jgi:hypothetical protein
MSLTKVSYSMINGPVGSVHDFMSAAEIAAADAGTLGVDMTASLQAAITAICGASGILLFPPGSYTISQPLTFPNKAFVVRGCGPTATSISEINGSGQIKLFDLSGITGPSVFIEKMGFFGPAGAGTLGGTGCYTNISNGIAIRDCWFAGLLEGVRKTNQSSFLRVLDCTFEFNFSAIIFEDGVQCIINNTTFYRNNIDYSFSGAFSLSTVTNSTHGETRNFCVYLNGVTDAIIENVTCRQDFDSNLPVILEMVNICTRNIIRNVRSINFGSRLVRISSASACTNNIFNGLYATIVPVVPPSFPLPVGTGAVGIEIGAGGTNNTFSNFNIFANDIGIVCAGNENKFTNGIVNNSLTTGFLIQAATDNEIENVRLVNNTVDWSTPGGGVATVWLSNVNSSLTGFAPVRYGQRGAGTSGRIFYGTAVPTTLAYLIGDVVFNINPVVGQPKGWTCTVSGTPGTWVSQGNL